MNKIKLDNYALRFFVLSCLSGFLLINLLFTFQWRMIHDTPLMVYLSYLIDKYHYIPYKNFFDMNMPGTYFIHLFFGKLFGYSDLSLRIADIIYLSLISLFTWKWIKPLGKFVAWTAIVLFGLFYINFGPSMSMQREYLAILPILIFLYTNDHINFQHHNIIKKPIITNFFIGIAVLIKPQFAILFPLNIIYLLYINKSLSKKEILNKIIFSLIGFLSPILITFIYLLINQALDDFFGIAINYWPLYGQINGEIKIVNNLGDRINDFINYYPKFGGKWYLLIPASIGFYLSLNASNYTNNQKHKIIKILFLSIVFSIYPAISGQYWDYHWLICYFFLLLGSSLLLSTTFKKNNISQLFLITFFVVFLFFNFWENDILKTQLSGELIPAPNGGRVDAITNYLDDNLQPGDVVQPLDWTGGAVHAMLQSNAKLATNFIYDFHFYHHTSNRYIIDLRKEFISQLHLSNPKYIISFEDNHRQIDGSNTSTNFPELDILLKTDYTIDNVYEDTIIYKRNN